MTERSKRAWRQAGWFGAWHFIIASALTALLYARTGQCNIIYCCGMIDILGLQPWWWAKYFVAPMFGMSEYELLNSNWWPMIGVLGFGTLQWVCFGWLYGYRSYRVPIGILCPNCEYNLTGNISGICPECGKSIVIARSD